MKVINRYSDLEAEGFGTRNTINAMIRNGKFPQPRDINDRPGWYKEDLVSWMESNKHYTPKIPEHLKKYVQPNCAVA